MCDCDALIEAAIVEGRISAEKADVWRRAFALAPELVAEKLAERQPDPFQATRNHFAANPDLVEVYEREFAADMGIKPEDVL